MCVARDIVMIAAGDVVNVMPRWVFHARNAENVVLNIAKMTVEFFANHVVTVVRSVKARDVTHAENGVFIIARTIVVTASHVVTAAMIVGISPPIKRLYVRKASCASRIVLLTYFMSSPKAAKDLLTTATKNYFVRG